MSNGKWPSSDAYLSAWNDDIQQAGYPVVAVLGSRVGSVYAAAIADNISRWQRRSAVILFDPQAAGIGVLSQEFNQELTSHSSLFSSEEIERARKISHRNAESARRVAVAAAEMFEEYREVITAPFERVGLGGPQDNKLTEPFESYISLISTASQIDPGYAWRAATVIVSSDYADVPDDNSPCGGRWIKSDVRRAGP